uniref:B30.2/SPRY domain-containing protein n=1 Tax=Periophthalmus magnuspinnatus TaxID=409849 RepID=A0A3B3Z988_9GOBI
TRTDVMKQQIHAQFEAMRAVLKQDEQAVIETLDIDMKRTREMLGQVLKTWNQHKSDGAEENIRLDEERFEKLVQMLSSVCKELRAQLQRKNLLLVDPQTCHPRLNATSDGKGLFYREACSSPEHPLKFDQVCCGLGSAPLCSGQGYWEVDVRCCSSWAVGVAYERLERKGRDKGSKLGRNRNSWCVEYRNEKLLAWHNDRNMVCHWVGVGRSRLSRVGMWVQFDKGQLVFFDAETMSVLHSFSAVMTTVFDRAHHQFTEPLYPAVRF